MDETLSKVDSHVVATMPWDAKNQSVGSGFSNIKCDAFPVVADDCCEPGDIVD